MCQPRPGWECGVCRCPRTRSRLPPTELRGADAGTSWKGQAGPLLEPPERARPCHRHLAPGPVAFRTGRGQIPGAVVTVAPVEGPPRGLQGSHVSLVGVTDSAGGSGRSWSGQEAWHPEKALHARQPWTESHPSWRPGPGMAGAPPPGHPHEALWPPRKPGPRARCPRQPS